MNAAEIKAISEQHMAYLERMAERSAFLYATLEARLGWTMDPNVRAFIEDAIHSVDETYPKVPLPSLTEVSR